MKWLKAKDYYNIISRIGVLYLLEFIFIDSIFIKLFLLILNIVLIYLLLYLLNNKYEKNLKRKAMEKKFIDDEYERLNKNV